MPAAKEILTSLTALPHRGSTSENEERAAQIVADWLHQFGLNPTVEPFQSVQTYSWEIIGIAGLMAIGVSLGPWFPVPGTLFTVLGLWSFWRHFTGYSTLFSPIIPKRHSQNVVARIPPAGTPEKTIILMAHYDSARSGLLWAPSMVKNFRGSFVTNAVLACILVPWTYLSTEWGTHLWYQVVSGALALYFLVQAGVFIHREIVHKFVNGANDNGSGVTAILTLAQQYAQHPLESAEIIIVATGCEEVGTVGAQAFLEQHFDDFDRENTYVLNFDNVGAGALNYCVGEGMLSFWHYDAEMVAIAEQLSQQLSFESVENCEYRLAYFDTLPIVQEQYKCMTFIGLQEDKRIPHWHWYTDTIENIDWNTIDLSIAWGDAFINRIEKSGE